jgi:hypothetical protein
MGYSLRKVQGSGFRVQGFKTRLAHFYLGFKRHLAGWENHDWTNKKSSVRVSGTKIFHLSGNRRQRMGIKII